MSTWQWALLAYLIAVILFVPFWAFIMRDRRRQGGN